MDTKNGLKCSQGVIALMRITGINWLHAQILLKQEKIEKRIVSGDTQTWVLEAHGKIGSFECFSSDGRLLFSEPIPIEEFSKGSDFAFTKLTVYVENRSILLKHERETH